MGLQDDGRELSNIGRETWDYILRARANALRKAGKDPHVLLPGSGAPKTRCVCGLDLSRRDSSESQDRPEREHVQDAENIGRIPDRNEAAESPAVMGLDWDAWDTFAMATLPGGFVQSPGFDRTGLD
jgi:hypothetical protein